MKYLPLRLQNLTMNVRLGTRDKPCNIEIMPVVIEFGIVRAHIDAFVLSGSGVAGRLPTVESAAGRYPVFKLFPCHLDFVRHVPTMGRRSR